VSRVARCARQDYDRHRAFRNAARLRFQLFAAERLALRSSACCIDVQNVLASVQRPHGWMQPHVLKVLEILQIRFS